MKRVETWLFPAGRSGGAAVAWTGLVAVIGARAAFGPYRALAGQPPALFDPPPLLSWLGGMPSAPAFVALQVIGTLAAIVAVVTGRRSAFAAALASLVVLAGLRGSLGKVLHNDVLLVLAAAPFALARRGDRWPVMPATVLVVVAYTAAGAQKMVTSGLDWVTGDTMRWILYAGAASEKAPTDTFALFVADRPWLATSCAAALVALELGFVLVLVWPRRLGPWFAVVATALHVGTWLTLGLDYWAWIAVDILVLAVATRGPAESSDVGLRPLRGPGPRALVEVDLA